MSEPVVFETFQEIGSWGIDNLTQKRPSCFNGNVRVRKYRITVELVDEPKTVIQERLQQLWDECDNRNHQRSLESAAKREGVVLLGEAGSRRKDLT